MTKQTTILIIVALLLFGGCIHSEKVQEVPEEGKVPEDSLVSKDSFVFIEQHIEVNTRALKENCSKNLDIDFQGYEFDPEKGVIRGDINFDIDKVEIVYGSWLSLRGDTGQGEMKRLTGINEGYRSDNVGIKELENDGTITLDYDGGEITLRPEEEWDIVSEKIIEGKECRFNQTMTTRIRNQGMLKKSNIERW